MSVPPYGVAIHQALASGDLQRMRQAVQQAEAYLHEHGDVRVALEALKLEIAKLEGKAK